MPMITMMMMKMMMNIVIIIINNIDNYMNTEDMYEIIMHNKCV